MKVTNAQMYKALHVSIVKWENRAAGKSEPLYCSLCEFSDRAQTRSPKPDANFCQACPLYLYGVHIKLKIPGCVNNSAYEVWAREDERSYKGKLKAKIVLNLLRGAEQHFFGDWTEAQRKAAINTPTKSRASRASSL